MVDYIDKVFQSILHRNQRLKGCVPALDQYPYRALFQRYARPPVPVLGHNHWSPWAQRSRRLGQPAQRLLGRVPHTGVGVGKPFPLARQAIDLAGAAIRAAGG